MAGPLTIRGQKTFPTPWQEKILKRDFDIVLGKMLQPEQRNETETEEPYLRSANVQWEGVDISDIKTMWFSPQEKKELLLRVGDLVVNEGGDVGRCATWNGELDTCYFQNAVNRVRPRQKASARFLYYWLYNIKNAGFIDAIVSRTTIAHLTAEKLEAIPWADAPPAEQQRIAAYLDASCAAIDAAVAAKRRQLEILDALKSSILLQALTLGLNQNIETRATGAPVLPIVPVGWGFRRLKSVATIRYGLGQPPVELSSGVAMIRATDVSAGTIRTGDFLRVDPDDLPRGRNPYLKSGEIIVVRSGAYTGDSAIVPPDLEGMVAGYDMVVTVTRASPRFVAYCLLSRYVLEGQILLLTLRAAQPHLNATELGSIFLALPPTIKEQEAIADFISMKFEELNSLVSTIKAQITTLTAYRKSLIHECVTGQRRITEADLNRVQHG
jgi:type I restriction enzyme S subunit